MMKKLAAWALLIVLAFGLAGCESMRYREDSGGGHELHPGHVGHEVH